MKVAACWAFFILWVVLTPGVPRFPLAQELTKQHLQRCQQVLIKHEQEMKYAPFSIRNLKVYSYGQGEALALEDGYGQRFKYYPLSLHDWLIYSFGAKGLDNTLLSAKNAFVASWPAQFAAMDTAPMELRQVPYPPLMVGAVSADGRLAAKIYQHPVLNKSYLVVNDHEHNDFAMVAFHDQVEEFLWLPDSGRLVFTATQSLTYRDGLYLWDLHTNQVHNLLEATVLSQAQGVMAAEPLAKEWYVKMAAYEGKSGHLYAWVGGKASLDLMPQDFFSPASLRIFAIPRPGEPLELARSLDPQGLAPALSLSLVPGQSLCQEANSLQQEWCQLPLQGAVDKVLERWQLFVENSLDTPLFAFGLWTAAFLYNDAYRLWLSAPADLQIVASHGEESDVAATQEILRSYGIELALAVWNYPLATGWQKATAHALWDSLTSAGQPLSLQLATMEFGFVAEDKDR